MSEQQLARIAALLNGRFVIDANGTRFYWNRRKK
jgi:hypothetical protein